MCETSAPSAVSPSPKSHVRDSIGSRSGLSTCRRSRHLVVHCCSVVGSAGLEDASGGGCYGSRRPSSSPPLKTVVFAHSRGRLLHSVSDLEVDEVSDTSYPKSSRRGSFFGRKSGAMSSHSGPVVNPTSCTHRGCACDRECASSRITDRVNHLGRNGVNELRKILKRVPEGLEKPLAALVHLTEPGMWKAASSASTHLGNVPGRHKPSASVK